MQVLWQVTIAAFFAGAVDAIVGGGGLITVPALLTSYPQLSPALLLGSNKCSSIMGTLVAARHYLRHVDLHVHWLLPAMLAAFVGSGIGAWCLTRLDPWLLRKLLPLVLLAVLVYTLRQRQFGLRPGTALPARPAWWLAVIMALAIGWYDGFFGPGTGSFFLFFLVRWLSLDFLQASAVTKLLNIASNLAALLLLALGGHVWWQLGLAMAAANMLGSLLGTRLALTHGVTLVRRVFIAVVTLLLLKTAWQAYFA